MKARQDRIASILFFILAVLIMVESVKLSLGDIHNPGPGFVTFCLGVSMAILSALSFLMPDRQVMEAAFWNNWQREKITLYIFIGMTIYLLLIRILGFYIDTFLLVIYFMRLLGEKRYKRIISFSVTALSLVYIVFGKLLIIPFPRGVLGM